MLVRALRATDVVVGDNFRFGHRGAGDVRLLRPLDARHDFTAHGVPLLPGCSSTRVRALIAAGAALVLGCPHRIAVLADGDRLSVVLPPDGRDRVRIDAGVTVVEVRGRPRVFALGPGSVNAVDLPERAPDS